MKLCSNEKLRNKTENMTQNFVKLKPLKKNMIHPIQNHVSQAFISQLNTRHTKSLQLSNDQQSDKKI